MYAIQVWDLTGDIKEIRTLRELPYELVATDSDVLDTLGTFLNALNNPQVAPHAVQFLTRMPLTDGYPLRGILVCAQAPAAEKDWVASAGRRGTFNYVVEREVPWPGTELADLQS